MHPLRVDDIRLGFAFRAARIRRRLRQQDLAHMAGVSDSLISRLEQGELARLSVAAVRAIASQLGIRLDLVARWQGGDLDRLVSARHAALGERVAVWIGRQPGGALSPKSPLPSTVSAVSSTSSPGTKPPDRLS